MIVWYFATNRSQPIARSSELKSYAVMSPQNDATKAINAANIVIMESTDNPAFDKKRNEVIGGPTDQGAERLVEGVCVDVIPGYTSSYTAAT